MTGLALRILGPRVFALVPWRLLAVLALLAGVGATYWAVNDRAYDRGVLAERHTWQAAAAELRRLQQAAADSATTHRATGTAKTATVTERVIKESHTYYVDRPIERDAVCLPAERVQAVNAARGAIASAAGGD